MWKFLILLMCFFLEKSMAQETIVIRKSQDLKDLNNTIQQTLNNLSADSLIHPQIIIGLEDEDFEKLNTTTVNVKGGDMTIITNDKGMVKNTIYKKRSNPYFMSFHIDLGYNRFDNINLFNNNKNTGGDMPALENNNSVSFAIYPAMVNIKLIGKHLAFTTGLGLEWFNFRFVGNTTMKNIDGVATSVPVSEAFGVENVFKSKLTASYINMPILLTGTIPGRCRGFSLSTGILLGMNLSSHTKVVHREFGGRTRLKNREDLGIMPLRYGFTGRVSYSIIGCYVNYYMTPLFSKNEGPQVYPYVVGMSLTF